MSVEGIIAIALAVALVVAVIAIVLLVRAVTGAPAWAEKYATAATERDQAGLAVKELGATVTRLRKEAEVKDAQIALLEANLKEARRNAVITASDHDLLDMANGVSARRDDREAGPSPGPGGGGAGGAVPP